LKLGCAAKVRVTAFSDFNWQKRAIFHIRIRQVTAIIRPPTAHFIGDSSKKQQPNDEII
jgi:hypothetical protein